MPFIYKPIRQFMQPNETTIDPKIRNRFSLVIGGQLCIAYRFRVFDLQNNLISSASTEKTNTTVTYEITSINLLQDMFVIASNNLNNGDAVQFLTDGVLPSPLTEDTTYYVGNVEYGRFNVFTTKDDALNNENKIDILDEGEGNHSIFTETPLYDGETLNIYVEANTLEAGNTYKWQVELYANDLQVTNVNIEDDTLTIPNHNLVTGDMVYISATTLPTPITAYTVYYVRKIDNNTIALFSYIEGARNDAGRIDLTDAGADVIVSNIAISEQIVFSVYDNPVVVFDSQVITQQAFTFKPSYSHPQGVMISSFTAYLRPENNPDAVIDSGLQENVRLEYTFDGLLSGTVYDVKFIINTKVDQVYETEWVPFEVDYITPNLGLSPTVTNNEQRASIDMKWSGIKQIIGDMVGQSEFIDDFINPGNTGLKLYPDSYLTFSNLNIERGSSPPMFWWNPVSADFTGRIMRCENTLTGEYIEIGYNGVNFYRIINGGEPINNAPMILHPEFLYMIGMTEHDLIVNVVANINS